MNEDMVKSSSMMNQITPELKKRVITGAIGATLVLCVLIFLDRVGARFLSAVFSLFMLYEFINISFFHLTDMKEKRLVMLGVSWLTIFLSFIIPGAQFELLLFLFFSIFGYFLFTANRHEGEHFQQHFQELMYGVFAALYLVLIPIYFPMIRNSPGGIHWSVMFLLIIWGGDVGAYFTGKKYGRRKLYPAISPKKTLEGAGGGMATSVVIAILYKLIFFKVASVGGVILTAILVNVFAQVGDLCESFFKRAFHKKDSGSILPGHGGFLDRFDSFVFSLPVMYACVRLFS